MKKIQIRANDLTARILLKAFKVRNLPTDIFSFVRDEGGGHSSVPQAVILQPGGIRALLSMGIDIQNTTNPGDLNIYKKDGKKMLSLRLPEPGARVLSKADLESLELEEPHWQIDNCKQRGLEESRKLPNMLLRVVSFGIQSNPTMFLLDLDDVVVGCFSIDKNTALLYGLHKNDGDVTSCKHALDSVPRKLLPWSSIVSEKWFEIGPVGYRSCWDGETLLWGSHALKLHPLTGQHISHWAKQADMIARYFERHGTLDEKCFRLLDRQNKLVYRRHVRLINYFIKPGIVWRLARFMVNHSTHLQKRSVRLLGLT